MIAVIFAIVHPVESTLTVNDSGDPLSQENLVQFHLLYSGPLHSNGSPREKLAIRRALHPQLKRLWETNSSLVRLAQIEGQKSAVREAYKQNEAGVPPSTSQEFFPKGIAAMGRNWNRGGFDYVPLVTEEYCLRCCLDILFLRVEERDYILQGGDIDGRLKTLFDGLRMAREKKEIPNGESQKAEEMPMFVLLENDQLVSQINIDTGQLLWLPEGKEGPDKRDVYLQITVKLNPAQYTQYSYTF
jgi:hypothetical protein